MSSHRQALGTSVDCTLLPEDPAFEFLVSTDIHNAKVQEVLSE